MLKKAIVYILIALSLIEVCLQLISFWNRREFFITKTFDPKSFRVLVVGESTSHGVMLSDKRKAYPYVLEKLLEKRLGRPVHVYNYSIPGNTSYFISERIEDYLAASKPDLVISHFGNNDFNPVLNKKFSSSQFTHMPSIIFKVKLIKFFALFVQELTYKERAVTLSANGKSVRFNNISDRSRDELFLRVSQHLFENYSDVILKARKKSSRVIMVSYFQTFYNTRKTLEKVSSTLNVPLIRLHRDEIASELLSEDLWHPSVEGHKYIAQLIYDELDKVLSDINK